MSMTVNNVGTINWQAVLDGVNAASGAEQISETNRNVTFTAVVNGQSVTVEMKIPDDLDLPGEVTPAAIDDLMAKLINGNNTFSQDQLLAIKTAITNVYNEMASALSTTLSTSTGKVMFDLYKLMALLVEVAQSQRDAARDLRTAESQQIQNSIQAQADAQRDAAMVGLIVGVTCGVISAVVSAGMMIGQTVAFKGQMTATRASGADAAQNKVTMLQNADTPEHAQAQLAKVEGQVRSKVAGDVKTAINDNGLVKDAKAQLDAKVPQRQALETAKSELKTAQQELGAKRLDSVTKRIAAGLQVDEKAVDAKVRYVQECTDKHVDVDPKKMAAFDEAALAEDAVDTAKANVTAKEGAVREAKQAYITAMEENPEARADYRAALETAAEQYAAKYEAAVARNAPKAEIDAARNEMRMARAYVNNEIMSDPGLKSSATEYQKSLTQAKTAADVASQRLDANVDYKKAMHRMNVFGGINSINVAIGNTLQSMTQSISGIISSEATRQGAETQKEEERLDETKEMFSQAQGVIDAAIQLMNAVIQAETQSMRDAIQA